MRLTRIPAVAVASLAASLSAAPQSPSPVASPTPLPAEKGTTRWIRTVSPLPMRGVQQPPECAVALAAKHDNRGRLPTDDLFRSIIKADVDHQALPREPGTRVLRYVTFAVDEARPGKVSDPLHPLVGVLHPVRTRYTVCTDAGASWSIVEQDVQYTCVLATAPGDWSCKITRPDPSPRTRQLGK